MSTSDITLLIIAAIPVVYFCVRGWRFGAALEIRSLLVVFFGMLVAVRYWEPCAGKVSDAVTFDPRWVALAVFVVLFVAGVLAAGVVVNLKGKSFQSVNSNIVNQLLGVCCGLVSGAVLSACFLWLATVAVPGKFEATPGVLSVIEAPRTIVKNIETAMGVATGSTGRTHFPEVTMVAAPGDRDAGQAAGTEAQPQRGQVAWK